MTIKQEFFEAFGIEPKYTYDIKGINAFGGVFTETISSKDKFKKEAWRWETKEYRYDRKVIKVNKHYPPITPEIVLGLISLYPIYEIFVLPISYKDEFENKWNPEKIKCYILEQIISLIKYKPNLSKEITEKVKALFKC